MTRTVREMEGLAVGGEASVGPLPLSVPALFESRRPGEAGAPDLLFLEAAESPDSGVRVLRLGSASTSVELRFPVPVPEISGIPGGTVELAPRQWAVHWPATALELVEVREARPELVVLSNARALWNEGEPFVRAVGELRKALGAEALLWVPRVALPNRIPLLVYLGVDVVDTTAGLWEAARGIRLDETLGTEPAVGALPRPTEEHAREEYRRSLERTRAALRSGRLRELVEARLASEPALSEMLRYSDRTLGDALEQRSPVASLLWGRYVLAESFRRPAVRRFRDRVRERYRPPPSKEILFLVPCSRTKPYRVSRSHRRLQGALEGLSPLERIHWVSLSSPVGIVPRELEDVYPARHYDVPVTGEWSEPEREAIQVGLKHLLAYGSYRSIIAHLDPREYSFVRGPLGDRLPVAWTLGEEERTTRPEALASLRGAMESALKGLAPVPGGPLAVVREELAEIAAWQFGRDASARLFDGGVRLAGRPWFQRLTDGRTDLATLREERGIFHLTVAGARRQMPEPPLAVEIDDGVSLQGDLFVPGVRRADPAIRAGDSVILLREGRLAGVGEAAISGPMMRELARGLAVYVRHRERAVLAGGLMATGSPPGPGPVV